jgi:hypothetical protein
VRFALVCHRTHGRIRRWHPPVPIQPSSAHLLQREFRAVLVARGTSILAMAGLTTAVAFQTYEVTRDPLALGWLGLVEAIPALSLVLLGGSPQRARIASQTCSIRASIQASVVVRPRIA